jgi:hypothetical protein
MDPEAREVNCFGSAGVFAKVRPIRCPFFAPFWLKEIQKGTNRHCSALDWFVSETDDGKEVTTALGVFAAI